MALAIDTFSNQSKTGSAFFKAAGHPLAVAAARAIVAKIRAAARPVAYDPQNTLTPFAQLYPLGGGAPAAVYAQDVARLRAPTLGLETLPVTRLAADKQADLLFAPLFDADAALAPIRRLLPAGCEILTLDRCACPIVFSRIRGGI